jgi:hypothetical protein
MPSMTNRAVFCSEQSCRNYTLLYSAKAEGWNWDPKARQWMCAIHNPTTPQIVAPRHVSGEVYTIDKSVLLDAIAAGMTIGGKKVVGLTAANGHVTCFLVE